MNKILSKTKQIEFTISDTCFNGAIKPTSILSYCQDIAVEHAIELELGRKDLLKENLFWVVTKFSARILKQPQIYSKNFISTYPLKSQRAEAIRDYYFKDENGDILIKASSSWSVLDIEKRRIRRCNTLFDKFGPDAFTTDMAIEGGIPKLTMPDINSDFKKKFRVNLSDLDENIHMNNANYGNIIINVFDLDKFNKSAISGFDLYYMSELKLNDEYYVKKADFENFSLVEAFKESNGGIETCFKAKVYWKV